MDNVVEARITINSNPDTAHIGRYTVQMFKGERPGAIKVTNDPADLVRKLTAAGLDLGYMVVMDDQTGE
jgi:hypothetical protein